MNLRTIILTISTIRKAISSGVKHYNNAGQELTTTIQIIKCILKEHGFNGYPANLTEQVYKGILSQTGMEIVRSKIWI